MKNLEILKILKISIFLTFWIFLKENSKFLKCSKMIKNFKILIFFSKTSKILGYFKVFENFENFQTFEHFQIVLIFLMNLSLIPIREAQPSK